MRLALVLVCLLSLTALPAVARDYVVSAQDAAARDDGPGDAATPLRTINEAAQRVEPGDVVRVRAGVYREHVALTRCGTEAAPVQFVADPPGSVILSGADVLEGWRRLDGPEPIYSRPWNARFIINTNPDGTFVEHHPGNAPLWGRAELVLADGAQLGPAASVEELRELWRRWNAAASHEADPQALAGPGLPDAARPESWAGAFFADTANQRLYVWLAGGDDPAGHVMEGATRDAVMGLSPWANPAGVHDVQVRGFVFRHCATFPQRAGVWLQGARNLVEDCVIEEMAGAGVSVSGTLRRCVVRRCGQCGGSAGGPGFVNEDCTWEGNCWKPIDRGWDAGGVKLCWTDGGRFERCIFRRNGGPGLWFDIDARNILVTGCVFEGNEGSGLFIEISRKITVRDNLFLSNCTRESGLPAWSNGGIQLAESMDCVVTGNTCVGNKDGITLREQGPRPLDTEYAGTIPYHNARHVIEGNVFAGNLGYALGLWYDNGFFGWHPGEVNQYPSLEAFDAHMAQTPERLFDPLKAELRIDHNVYQGAQGRPLVLYGCDWRPRHRKFDTLADFTDLTGFDAHSDVGDPGLMDPAAGDYRPREGGLASRMKAGWQDPLEDLAAYANGRLPVWLRGAR